VATLEINNVTKRYKAKTAEITAVDGVSFNVDAGEVVGFVGPNGAGKSTLIKMITGLAIPTEGSVSVCGFDNNTKRKQALSNIGAVVENPDLYLEWTGLENLKYLMSISTPDDKRSKEYDAARIDELLKLVGLFDRRKDKVRSYSLGMKQRLGIAQALLSDPKLLVLDEPANGLDPTGIKEIRDILRRLASEHNMAVLVSSHQLSELQQTCDRFIVINKGKVVAAPTKDELSGGQGRLILSVDDVIRAKDILKDRFLIEAKMIANGKLEVVSEMDAAVLTKELILSGIMVSGAERTQATLEDLYMSLTVKKQDAPQPFDEFSKPPDDTSSKPS